jgi:hypothetical protein
MESGKLYASSYSSYYCMKLFVIFQKEWTLMKIGKDYIDFISNQLNPSTLLQPH